MMEQYHAVLVPRESQLYQEKYKEYRASLLIKHRPDLLDEAKVLETPSNMEDTDAIMKWLERARKVQQKAMELSEDVFSIQYQLYEIEDGEMYVEIEHQYECLSIEWSGEGKLMDSISKIIE